MVSVPPSGLNHLLISVLYLCLILGNHLLFFLRADSRFTLNPNDSLILRNNIHEITVQRGPATFFYYRSKQIFNEQIKQTNGYHLVPVTRKALNKLKLRDFLQSHQPVIFTTVKFRRDSPCDGLSQIRGDQGEMSSESVWDPG